MTFSFNAVQVAEHFVEVQTACMVLQVLCGDPDCPRRPNTFTFSPCQVLNAPTTVAKKVAGIAECFAGTLEVGARTWPVCMGGKGGLVYYYAVPSLTTVVFGCTDV